MSADTVDQKRTRAAHGAPTAWLLAAVSGRDRSECWLDWPYGCCAGYPTIRSRKAGRTALEMDGRPQPPSPPYTEMCHAPACLSSLCLNPDHLRWDTRAENLRDKKRAVLGVGDVCAVAECEKRRERREWCNAHYLRWFRHGDPLAGGPVQRPRRACSVDGCDRPHRARGLCAVHYNAARLAGGF